MRKLLKWFILLLVVGIIHACISYNDRCIHQLMQETGIRLPHELDSCFLILIPGNGCGSCIQSAVDNLRETKDTFYIFICDSEKDFFLQSGGKKASTLSNLYLDKHKAATRMKMVTTYPMVYFLKGGKYVNRWPYSSQRKQEEKTTTTLTIDKKHLDFGKFDWTQKQIERIVLTNTGTDTLFISAIESSCECTTIDWTDIPVPPQGNTALEITFRAEETGEFERFVTIYCNVPESPLEIPIKGNAK